MHKQLSPKEYKEWLESHNEFSSFTPGEIKEIVSRVFKSKDTEALFPVLSSTDNF